MIRSLKGLAKYLGCEATVASLSRAVYKGTDCGAWLAVETRSHTVRRRVRTVRLVRTLKGIVPLVQEDGAWRRWVAPDEDGTIRLALEGGVVDPEAGQTLDEIEEAARQPGLFRRVARGRSHVTVEWEYEQRVPGRLVDVGVQIGSIVEGADACVEPATLAFPFTEKEWDEAIEWVEDEATRIWNETHGCDECDRDGAINPECKACKGEGTIL